MSEKAAKKTPAKKAGAKKTTARKRAPKEKSEGAVHKAEVKIVEWTPPPVAMVQSRHELSMHERRARGFSLTELASAGIALNVAKKVSLPVDVRRRSMLEPNVDRLKGWYVPEPKKESAETVEEPEKEEKPRKRATRRRATKKAKPSKTTKE